MKFSKLLVSLSLLTAGTLAAAQDVTIAKAAELGCHRVERLVDLGRIDEAYLTKFSALKIVLDSSGGAKFKWTGFQNAGSDGKAYTIELMQDNTGKTIGNPNLIAGSTPVAPTWPDKDPVTLMETALHYILENGPSQADVAPFYNALTEGVITQTMYNGSPVALVQFRNSQNASVLEVLVKFDGTVISTLIK